MTKKQTTHRTLCNLAHWLNTSFCGIFAQLLYFNITLHWLFFPCVRSTPAISLPVYLHHCPSSILGKYTI